MCCVEALSALADNTEARFARVRVQLAGPLEVRLTKAFGQVDWLTPTLLARAVAGQLVPQDPTDETAEKLLKRIKTSNP